MACLVQPVIILWGYFFSRYISLQAPQPLGFRDEIRSEVERLICSKNVAHCFDRPKLEAFAFLRVTCLDGFLKSSLFYSFLNDLLRSLSAAEKPFQEIGKFIDLLKKVAF